MDPIIYNNLPINKFYDKVIELLNYIHKELPNFLNSDEYKNILKKRKNEVQCTAAVCVFLTNSCKSKFYFLNNQPQKGSYSVDIGVYSDSFLIFNFEAKILPTPKGKDRSITEYIYSPQRHNGAGIQRFKDCKHGYDNDNLPLIENGMIAYIKSENFNYWLNIINKWIIEVGWNESEKLKLEPNEFIGKLISHHTRIDGSDLLLHHYWIYV
jgi:hypothetical protein